MKMSDLLGNAQLISKNDAWDIYNMVNRKLTIYICNPESANINLEQYKAAVEDLTSAVEVLKSNFLLCDARNFLYPISPETQNWLATVHSPRWNKAGLNKFALVMPADFVANLGAEQAIEEMDKTAGYQTRYFSNEQDAFDWFYES